MGEKFGITDLCPECQRKKEEERGDVKDGKKEDPWRKVSEALARVEECKFFCHHTLYDADGKEDPLIGTRTCSFTVKASCGHGVLKYGQCWDWRDGKFCPDIGNQHLTLRKFELVDLDRILKIEKASFPELDAYSGKRFENLYLEHGDDFLVAEKDNQVVGYVIGYDGGGFISFDSMAVDEKYRRSGIGTALIEGVFDRFRNKGFNKASLEVKTTNGAAISFYQKLGFQIKKILKQYYRDGHDAYLMERVF